MSEQQHAQQQLHNTQPTGKVKRQRIILIITISIVALTIAIIWILSSLATIPSFWATIISIIFAILGVLATILPPIISFYGTEHAHRPHISSVIPVAMEIHPVQIVPSLPEPLRPAITYHDIIGLPLPTNAKVIQQRKKKVEEIYAQIIQPDITAVVLTGIGGVGKSTLAALLYQYAEAQRLLTKGPFIAPALWLRIDSATTMVDLLGTLFELIDKSLLDCSNISPQEQAIRLFNALNSISKPRLVVLDQFENLLDWQTGYTLANRPGIGEWLDAINSQQCNCRILLTSRLWPKGTREYPPTYMQEDCVEGLAVAEGMDLLQKQGVKGADAELQRAVEYCQGHAFALTLLASLMRNHSLNLLALFHNSTYTQLWNGNIAQNLLDYIYKQQLDPLQRNLLSAFSVYRELVSLDAACAILEVGSEISKTQIQFAFHVLLAQHLLQAAGNGYYQLHSIVADYAQDHFVEHDEQANQLALRKSHSKAAIYYQQLAATACPSKELRRYISDIHLLLEVVWHRCQARQWQEAYDLMKQEDIFSALKRWGGHAILLELCQMLLESDQWSSESSQFAHIYNNLGDICWILGRIDQAQQYYNQTLQICQKITDYAEEGWAHNYLGRIYNALGNSKLAEEHLELALQRFKTVSNRPGEGKCITNLGWVHYDNGNMKQARLYFEQALNIFKDEGDQREEGLVYGYLGRVYDDIGQQQLARKYYEQALDMLRQARDRNGEGIFLCNLGRVCNYLGYHAQALEYIELALQILKEFGDRSSEGTALNDLGRVYADLGQKKQARDYFEQALHIRKEVGNRRGEARTLTDLGKISIDLGQIEQARNYFEQALQMLRGIEHSWREGRTLKNLSRVYILLGDKDQALQCYEQALSLYKRIGNHWEEGKILFDLGLLYLEQNRYDAALAFFILAQSVDNEVKDKYENKIQEQLTLISSRLSKEHFTALVAEIESRAEQIVKEMVKGYCQVDCNGSINL